MTTAAELRSLLHAHADPERAKSSMRFFKTGPGEYGEGDRFLGVSVPQLRTFAKLANDFREADTADLLHSEWHEERQLALFLLVRRYERAKDDTARKSIVDFYLANTRWVNNWDLVDSTSAYILGPWLLRRDRHILRRLVASEDMWEQRIAVLATFAFIRAGDFAETLALCELLLPHRHDLMHKACGWMLREVGKRDTEEMRGFLDKHTPNMPRTMLRYAIEKLPAPERLEYLSIKRA